MPGSPLPERIPFGVVLQGVIYGTSYALLAMGLILNYRTTRIVNFAYGAMGAMPGSITVGLFVAKGVNYWVAIVLGVTVGVATGAGRRLFVIRRFANSSRLVLTVATIVWPRSSARSPRHRRRLVPTRCSQHRHAAQQQLLRTPVPDPRRSSLVARCRARESSPPRMVPCCAPTRDARCAPRRRTKTVPSCSACPCAGCRRSCGRWLAVSPPSPTS